MTVQQNRMFHGYLVGSLYRETLAKTSCLHPILTFCIQVMCRAHASLRGKLAGEILAKTTLVFNCLESSHSLSHTQPLQINPTKNTGYIRLNKITIKFGTELKPT